jgi:hypothetical protein
MKNRSVMFFAGFLFLHHGASVYDRQKLTNFKATIVEFNLKADWEIGEHYCVIDEELSYGDAIRIPAGQPTK